MNRIVQFLAAAVLIGAMANPVAADEVDPADITLFEPGTPAVAEEVNANFAALIAAINDNAQRIAALEAVDAPNTIDGETYTFMTFEAAALASNCNGEMIIVEGPDGEIISETPGPYFCDGMNVRRLTLASNVVVLTFLADGTGTATEIYDEEMLTSPSSDGLFPNGLETVDAAFSSSFTFTWSQVGNLLTILDDDPEAVPFEVVMSHDNGVGIARLVLRGDAAGNGDWPVNDDDGPVGTRATKYGQLLGIAVRN